MDALKESLSKTKSLRMAAIPSKGNKYGYCLNWNNELVRISQ